MTVVDALRLPAWLSELPRDPRGFVIPAEAGWNGDQPDLSRNDPDIALCLAAYRACVICGTRIAAGEPVFRTFNGVDAERLRVSIRNSGAAPERMFVGHRSCMLYATMACPYWSRGTARISKSSQWAPATPRGTSPAVLGFSRIDYALDIARPGDTTYSMCFYKGLVDDIVFDDPQQDLVDLFDAACEAEAGRSTEFRVHFAPSYGGYARLMEMTRTAALGLHHAVRGRDARLGANGRTLATFQTPWL